MTHGGTGAPEPGGLLPREALKAVRMAAREGLCGRDLVEIAPGYDVHDTTAQLGARIIMDVPGHPGRRRAPGTAVTLVVTLA
jgi:arginase family enzyme